MATSGLYGNTSESIGLYGNTTVFGGSYFEWFIFQVSDLAPATPSGGSWDFTTNVGTPPAGWSSTPPASPTATVWVSIAVVNSKNTSTLTWSDPGKFAYSSGLPILSGTGTPGSGLGVTDQLYIQTDSAPETIWFKQVGTWTRLTGSTLYVDLTSAQTIAGVKTFASQIQGSVSGNAANVTGVVAVVNGGTGVTTSTGTGSVVLNNSPLLLTPTLSGATVDNAAPYLNFTPTTAPAHQEGRLFYDSAAHTLNYYNDNTQMSINIGQENIVRVRNQTGSTINEGTVVYVNGATGNSPTVALALATAFNTSDIVGVATTTIANNGFGYVTTSGLVNGLNTSAFTEGQAVFVSATTAGTFTATEPVAPNYSVQVGVILRANPSIGTLLVSIQLVSTEVSHIVGTVQVSQGGTGVTTSTGTGSVVLNTSPTLVTPLLGTPTSGNFSTGTFTWPTFNQSTTGNAATATTATNVSGGTANVTTLTTSSTVTLNGGTANGVTYLNGSKVLTSGTALTFDGTNFTAPRTQFTTAGSAPASGAGLEILGGTSPLLFAYNRGTSAYLPLNATASAFGWALSGSDAMILTSTGLGIGTSSPAQKLDVNGSAVFGAGSGNISINLNGANTGTGNGSYIGFKNGGSLVGGLGGYSALFGGAYSDNFGLYFTAGKSFIISDASSSTLTLTAGNLGLGVVPSAWDSTFKAFESGAGSTNGGSFFVQNNGDYTASIATNLYYNAGWKYKNSAPAARYEVYQNKHQWFNAPSGTAGNVITFTQAMTLDASGNLGIGTTSPSVKLDVNAGSARSINATGGSVVLASNGGAHTLFLGDNNFAYFQLYTPASPTYLAFQYNSSEKMRLDSSGNLGIGTTSPTAKLHVSGAGTVIQKLATTSGAVELQLIANTQTNASYSNIYSGDGTNWNWAIGGSNGTSNTMTFGTGGSERMRLDSSGNLGLGVTPSAWSVNYKVLQSGTGSAFAAFSGNDQTFVVSNAYNDGSWKYKNTAGAGYYQISGVGSGAHIWYSAPSGTAGAAISFTQAMTLDASGNLLVGGTTSPSGKANNFVNLGGSGGFWTKSGGVGYFGTFDNYAMILATNDTERARIDSSGNLLVGTTSSIGNAGIFQAKNPLNGAAGYFEIINNQSGNQNAIDITSVANAAYRPFRFWVNGYGVTEVGSISCTTTLTVYNTTSDYRLKTVVGAVTGQGARIDAIQPVEYTWNSNGSRTRGFLAHQFQEVYADSVTGTKDAVDAEGNPVYQAMQAGTSEVIADIIAEIQDLRKRLAAAGIA